MTDISDDDTHVLRAERLASGDFRISIVSRVSGDGSWVDFSASRATTLAAWITTELMDF